MKSKAILALSLITLFSLPSFGESGVKGTKNFREVFNGVFYYGGGKQSGRDNRNPLQNDTLERLCEAGFEDAIYLYGSNKSSMKRNTKCSKGSLNYDYVTWIDYEPIMKKIYSIITNPSKGPLYVHCFNGHHASNAIAVMARMQFCGMSNSEAKKLWLKNSDGRKNFNDFRSVGKRLDNFRPNSSLQITSAQRSKICN